MERLQPQQNMSTSRLDQSLSTDRLDRALSAQTSTSKVERSATLDVNVNAPRGTKVEAGANGLFRGVTTRRSVQMPGVG